MSRCFAALVGVLAILLPGVTIAATDTLRLVTTTSTDNSGLMRSILPKFEEASGLKVLVIAVGTGRALALGENGDADVVLVHSRPDEERFIARGFGVDRRDVMHNDFVLVGPKTDPAGIRGGHDVIAALKRVIDTKVTFVSRGDASGTDQMEHAYWAQVGKFPDDRHYLSAGLGQGDVLVATSQMRAYMLVDRGTYSAYRSRIALDILVDGDPRMLNRYGVIAVNPARNPGVNYKAATRFIEWITGAEGKRAIGEYRVGGEQLFFPADR